jgi:hypothetical protein
MLSPFTLARAKKFAEIVVGELKKREKPLECDDTIEKITIEIILGNRAHDPVQVRFSTSSATRLSVA